MHTFATLGDLFILTGIFWFFMMVIADLIFKLSETPENKNNKKRSIFRMAITTLLIFSFVGSEVVLYLVHK